MGQRTGRRVQCARVLRGINLTIWDVVQTPDQLRYEGHDRVRGRSVAAALELVASWYSVHSAPAIRTNDGAEDLPVGSAIPPARCKPVQAPRDATLDRAFNSERPVALELDRVAPAEGACTARSMSSPIPSGW
jgi:hypothetical protein